MSLTVIDHHSVDLDRLKALKRPAPVLDVGCRGFEFAKRIRELTNAEVWALDPSPDVKDPGIPGVHFLPLALVSPRGPFTQKLAMRPDPEATHLVSGSTPVRVGDTTVDVAAVDMDRLSKQTGISFWGLVKLNCEGSEYGILDDWPGPIADQIVVSFHEHTGANYGWGTDTIMHKMLLWYDVVQHIRDERYCAGWNHWDSVLQLGER